MTTTETRTEALNVAEAISQVSRLVGAVPKGGEGNRNTQGKGYDFRGIDRVVNAVAPAMLATGLVIRPHKVKRVEYVDVLSGSNRTPMLSTRIVVRFKITAPDGSFEYGEAAGEAFDSGDKGTAKAMSVALRTFLLQTFMLPTTERDPDEDTYERSEPAGRVHGQQQQPDPQQDAGPQWRDWFDLALAKPDPIEALTKLLAAAHERGAPDPVLVAVTGELDRRRAVDVHANPVHEQASHDTREWWATHGLPVSEVSS